MPLLDRVTLAWLALAVTCVWPGITGFAGVEAAEWPQFRGPSGEGQAAASGLPLTWSESENTVWKTPVAGRGWSSPVIDGSQIWLTTAAGRSLRALALDRDSGRLLLDVEVFRLDGPPAIHQKNSYASPTPILDTGRVYVHFGPLGTAALKRDGSIVWKRQLNYQHGHGPGGSPALWGELLIINCDGTDQQYVVALDKETGEIRWRTERRDGAMSYSTPLIIRAGPGEQVISPGANRAVAYDPRTGREIWWIGYDGFSVVPRPVFGHGLVFLTSGFYRPILFAVRPGGRGDVSHSQVAWTWERGVPLTPSPLLAGDELYLVSDNGIVTCLDAKTGREQWRERLPGRFSASPLAAEGRVYFLNESGETTVVEAGRNFTVLARNRLDGETLASLAVAGRAIFLRTASHLYRIEQLDGP